MTIEYKKEVSTFGEIEAGSVFSAANYIFIKTNQNTAVELSDGRVFTFNADELVEPENATLVIE